MINPINILIKKIFKRPPTIPAEMIKDIEKMSEQDRYLLQTLGFTSRILEETVREATLINFERQKLYREIDAACLHWAMGASVELFADFVTTYSPLHNATVWITSENKKYETELNGLLETIQIEEKIFDWAWTTGAFGDHFVKVNAIPGVGVVSVEDDEHPINISRVDNKVLVGFFKTPLGYAPDTKELLPPWEYVHFRILGAKRKRPLYDDPSFSEYRTIHLLSPESRRLTSKYGTSLLTNALPVYKRLRMAEDCLLFARISRGITRNIFKIKVDMCLEGDTKIALLDGKTPTIKQMADKSNEYVGKCVWSINPETLHIEYDKIIGVKKTRENAQLVRVHLDNGEYVDATEDHKFMLRNGTYKEAQYLCPGNSLMPLYTKKSKGIDDYLLVYDPANKVVKIEWLQDKKDTYDIQTENNHNFALACGIYVHNSNMEAAAEIIQSYKRLLKRSTAMDTRSESALFDSKYNPLTTLEDIFLPVFGDVGDVTIEEMGGKVDIKWIVDIEELRNQLSCALRVPLQLLGGFVEEATGALGSTAIEKLDIRFARAARRLQRAQIGGVTRIAQIHLAYKNMNPDPTLFKVNMPETSTAEEESLKATLETGVDVVDKIMKTLEDAGVDVDKVGMLNFLNQKILKLGDVDFSRFIRGEKTPETIETVECVLTEARKYLTKRRKPKITNSDLVAHLPEKKAASSSKEVWTNEEWKSLYGSCKVKIDTEGVNK